MRKKIGIFGGSFDPIHIGHVALACAFREQWSLDTVYFVPTNSNPLKTRMLTAALHRRNMLELALQGTDFVISTIELDRPAPSYTIDTVKELQKREPADYHLLMGSDTLSDIDRWKSYQELFSLVKPLIAVREPLIRKDWTQSIEINEVIKQGICQVPRFDVSATTIRMRLQQGLFCGHLLDRGVYQYIQKEGLYQCRKTIQTK